MSSGPVLIKDDTETGGRTNCVRDPLYVFVAINMIDLVNDRRSKEVIPAKFYGTHPGELYCLLTGEWLICVKCNHANTHASKDKKPITSIEEKKNRSASPTSSSKPT